MSGAVNSSPFIRRHSVCRAKFVSGNLPFLDFCDSGKLPDAIGTESQWWHHDFLITWRSSPQFFTRMGTKPHTVKKVERTHVQALRLCTGRTAHRGSTGIALLFLDHGTRRGWGASVTPRPFFTPGIDPVPIVQEAGWAPGPVWTGAENLAPTGIRSPDRAARSQSLYRLCYPAHKPHIVFPEKCRWRAWPIAWSPYSSDITSIFFSLTRFVNFRIARFFGGRGQQSKRPPLPEIINFKENR